MAEATTHDEHAHAGHGHDEIHLPPNSWVPISTALSITTLFIGFLVGVWLDIIGGVWLIAILVAWFRGARTEFGELGEHLGGAPGGEPAAQRAHRRGGEGEGPEGGSVLGGAEAPPLATHQQVDRDRRHRGENGLGQQALQDPHVRIIVNR